MDRSTCLYGLAVLLLTFNGVFAEDDDSNTCTDLRSNKTYQVGETWPVKGNCSNLSCMLSKVPILPDIVLPMITRHICTDPNPPDNDRRNCHQIKPYPNDAFPKCCPQLICIRNGYQIVIKPKF